MIPFWPIPLRLKLRIILVGIRNDLNFKIEKDNPAEGLLPLNDHLSKPPDLVDLLSDLIDKSHKNGGENKQYLSNPNTNIQKSLRTTKSGKISLKGDALTEQEYSNHSERIIKKFKFMIENDGKIMKILKAINRLQFRELFLDCFCLIRCLEQFQ